MYRIYTTQKDAEIIRSSNAYVKLSVSKIIAARNSWC